MCTVKSKINQRLAFLFERYNEWRTSTTDDKIDKIVRSVVLFCDIVLREWHAKYTSIQPMSVIEGFHCEWYNLISERVK